LAEGEEVISLRLAVPAVLVAAAVAGCLTYFVSPQSPVEADQRSPPTAPKAIGRPDPGVLTNNQPTEDEIIAYQRAPEAILKRAQNHRGCPAAKETPAPASMRRKIAAPRGYFHDRKASKA